MFLSQRFPTKAEISSQLPSIYGVHRSTCKSLLVQLVRIRGRQRRCRLQADNRRESLYVMSWMSPDHEYGSDPARGVRSTPYIYEICMLLIFVFAYIVDLPVYLFNYVVSSPKNNLSSIDIPSPPSKNHHSPSLVMPLSASPLPPVNDSFPPSLSSKNLHRMYLPRNSSSCLSRNHRYIPKTALPF